MYRYYWTYNKFDQLLKHACVIYSYLYQGTNWGHTCKGDVSKPTKPAREPEDLDTHPGPFHQT